MLGSLAAASLQWLDQRAVTIPAQLVKGTAPKPSREPIPGLAPHTNSRVAQHPDTSNINLTGFEQHLYSYGGDHTTTVFKDHNRCNSAQEFHPFSASGHTGSTSLGHPGASSPCSPTFSPLFLASCASLERMPSGAGFVSACTAPHNALHPTSQHKAHQPHRLHHLNMDLEHPEAAT